MSGLWRPLLLAILALLISCSRFAEPVDYSKVARFPDDKGEVTAIDFVKVRLADSREYEIRKDVQSFVSYTGRVTSLLSWKGKYVHLGLDEDKNVLWIAGIGVIDRSADPPSVYYTDGIFERMARGRSAVFKEGTVLTLGDGLDPPPVKAKVTARIDATKHVVVEFPVTRKD